MRDLTTKSAVVLLIALVVVLFVLVSVFKVIIYAV